jgi:nucleoside-diphosphate kinase
MDRTFVMIKPDAVARGLVGEIISRIEHKGLKVAQMKMMTLTRELAEENYAEHRDKPFYGDLVDYVMQGPVVVMVLEGEQAVPVARTLIGATHPAEAAPGTIRGDFGLLITENIVHGSDSTESAEREIGIFFG